MTLPKNLDEWEKKSRAWAEQARRMIPAEGYGGGRRRPRDPGEERALRAVGADRQMPFGLANLAADAALQIRMARKRAGVTQVELARRMGVTQQQVQRLEDPARSNPTVGTLRAVAEALGVEVRIRFE